ncbi:zinc finger protein rotund-like [Bacillus rossius redtenbacheri]|uniref:zinc finger protein rotund-like n=1 Tax=Bacillus rossius redtenbacheri TaxID=93214 RepID=UPI002FDD2288
MNSHESAPESCIEVASEVSVEAETQDESEAEPRREREVVIVHSQQGEILNVSTSDNVSLFATKKQVFGSKEDLTLYVQKHLRETKAYVCPHCGKAFANSSYLSQHTRIHNGIKPYGCEICQRKFTQLSHLQQHTRTHTGDKPYRCSQAGCGKTFSQLSNLQSHSRCHQADKPYKCGSCYKCFADSLSFFEHKELSHLKTHVCPHCGKPYAHKISLMKHVRKHSEQALAAAHRSVGTDTCDGPGFDPHEYLGPHDDRASPERKFHPAFVEAHEAAAAAEKM